MMTGMIIRPFSPADLEPVVALWSDAGLTRPWNDPRSDALRAHATYPELFLVATERDAIVGTMMAGDDGHRGWVYYLAVAADLRRTGLGRTLMARAEELLTARGCAKIQLMVRSDNADVVAFYDRLGYERSDVAVLGRRLDADA